MTAIICHLEEKIVMELLFPSWNPSSAVVMVTFDKCFAFLLPLPHPHPGWCGNKKTFACDAWDTGLLWLKRHLQKGMENSRIEFKSAAAQSSGPTHITQVEAVGHLLWEIWSFLWANKPASESGMQNRNGAKRKKAKKKTAPHQKWENLNDFV